MSDQQTYDDILPNPGLTIEAGRTAVVITDPQKDFLSEDGVVWGVVGASVVANNTVEPLRQLLSAALDSGIPVFVSPHYYYPHDHAWEFGGALEKMMHAVGMFDREGALTTSGFDGSGANRSSPCWSARKSWSRARTRSTVPSPTTWCCNCASGESTR